MKKLLIAIVTVSVIAGSAMAEAPKGKKDGHKGEGMMSSKVIKSLPQEKQAEIKAILEKDTSKTKMKSLIEQKKQLLNAEKFDKAAFIKNAEAIKDLKEDLKDNRIKVQAEILSILTPEQRVEVAKSWQKPDKKGPKDKKGQKGKDKSQK